VQSIPKRWLELRVRDAAAAEPSPLLVEGLIALGARAAEEIDGWYVTAVEEPKDPEAFVARAADTLRQLTGSNAIQLETALRKHEDWAETWRRGLAPRRITERILVRPSWCEPPAERCDIEIVLDPGMAFGTAEHATTRGCLRLLDGTVKPGDRVLDVGSGSGILSIAAAHLGANEVIAIEADPLSCEALAENLADNGVTNRVRCVEKEVGPDDLIALGPASGVVANIESGPLTRLMSGFAGALRPGGWLILSGILDAEWSRVRSVSEAAGFHVREVDAEGEWLSALLTRQPRGRASGRAPRHGVA
jgi:ribosomal protein L11 methyltransferase